MQMGPSDVTDFASLWQNRECVAMVNDNVTGLDMRAHTLTMLTGMCSRTA